MVASRSAAIPNTKHLGDGPKLGFDLLSIMGSATSWLGDGWLIDN